MRTENGSEYAGACITPIKESLSGFAERCDRNKELTQFNDVLYSLA